MLHWHHRGSVQYTGPSRNHMIVVGLLYPKKHDVYTSGWTIPPADSPSHRLANCPQSPPKRHRGKLSRPVPKTNTIVMINQSDDMKNLVMHRQALPVYVLETMKWTKIVFPVNLLSIHLDKVSTETYTNNCFLNL